jgi:hypothetical protein
MHDVPNKNSCISDTVSKLKPLIQQLAFPDAYGAGGMLEKANYKKDAADFYQRAYNVYDGTAQGDNLMTKDQLKKHINELRA